MYIGCTVRIELKFVKNGCVNFTPTPPPSSLVQRASTITERRKTHREGKEMTMIAGGGGEPRQQRKRGFFYLFLFHGYMGEDKRLSQAGAFKGNIQEKNYGYVVFKLNIH